MPKNSNFRDFRMRKTFFLTIGCSDHSRNVNGNELVNFNLVQKKIIHFIKKILEVKASVIITDGTICTTAFVTYSQIQYNSTILFNYCMVLYCTHRSLGFYYERAAFYHEQKTVFGHFIGFRPF